MKSVKRVAAVVSSLAVILVAFAAPSTAADHRPPRVGAKDLGVEVATSAPIAWRAERLADGGLQFVVGPGTSSKPIPSDAVQIAASDDAAAAAPVSTEPASALTTRSGASAAAAAAWSCTVQAPAQVTLDTPYLDSWVGAVCDGRPGTMQLAWQFQRSSWRGWVGYAPVHETAWTSAQAMGTDVSSVCMVGDGTYNYRVESQLNVQGTGVAIGSNLAWSNGNGRFNCGPSSAA